MRLLYSLTLAASFSMLGACGRMEVAGPLDSSMEGVTLDSLSHPAQLFDGLHSSACPEQLFTAHLSNSSDTARSMVLRASFPGYSDTAVWVLTLSPRSDTSLSLSPALHDSLPLLAFAMPMRLGVYDLHGTLYESLEDTIPYMGSMLYVPECASAPALPVMPLPTGFLGYNAPPRASIASLALSQLSFPADDELPDTWLKLTAPDGVSYSSSLNLNDSASVQSFVFPMSPVNAHTGSYQAILYERDADAEIALDTITFILSDSLLQRRSTSYAEGSLALALDWFYPADNQATELFKTLSLQTRTLLADSLWNSGPYTGLYIRPLASLMQDSVLYQSEAALLLAASLKTAGLDPLVVLTPKSPLVGWYIDSTHSAANFLDIAALHGSGFTEANQLGVSRYQAEAQLPGTRLLKYKVAGSLKP